MDFTFGWEGADPAIGAYRHLAVVDLRGVEEIGALYRYELTLFAAHPAPEVDPADLIGKHATLRLQTLGEPESRVVHGILVEAEDLHEHASGMLYRVVLAPVLTRAAHRTRCRIFLDKTLRRILTAVLSGEGDLVHLPNAVVFPDEGDETQFTAARALFTFRVEDPARLDDVTARPYCVQYNESDLAFASRLLEEEGLSFHFENGEGASLLVISDTDRGRTRLSPFVPLRDAPQGGSIDTVKLGARLRPRRVTLDDYNWKNPALDMKAAEAGRDDGAADLFRYEYPGRYPESPAQGQPMARAQLDRLQVEAEYAVAKGVTRLLGAGFIFALEHPRQRYQGEYLVTRLACRGEQAGVLPQGMGRGAAGARPFEIELECARRGRAGAPAESRYRPARSTARPRILGTQTAFVTAEPGLTGEEIHIGGPAGAEIGCVRVRFHWDREEERIAREPSSCWVRVSQVFAGGGEGAVFHPRVGTEVIVDFEDGDPDRPIIVGRVYNGRNRPPSTEPTVSSMKSATSPGGGSAHEIRMDDAAGKQQLLLHTPRDWNAEVGKDRSEVIGENSFSVVGQSRDDQIGENRTASVGVNDHTSIGMNASLAVGGDRDVQIAGNQTRGVGGNETLAITGAWDVSVTGKHALTVTGFQQVQIGGWSGDLITAERYCWVGGLEAKKIDGTQRLEVGGAQEVIVHGAQSTTYDAAQTVLVGGAQSTQVNGGYALTSPTITLGAGADGTFTAVAALRLGAADLTAAASNLVTVQGAAVQVEAGAACVVQAPVLTLVGGSTVTIAGGPAAISCGGASITMAGGVVKIN